VYAHLILFMLGPDKGSIAEEVADQFAPAYRSVKGFKSITFLGDDTTGEYGSISLWESKEDLEAFRKVAGPRLEEALSGKVLGPPSIRMFKVYTPQT
jgi:heme-degrading monooxygenase HmoA